MDHPKPKRRVAIALEATGASPDGGQRIVELAIAERFDETRGARFWHCYFNPERPMPTEIVMRTGLTDEFLRDKPTFSSMCVDIVDFLGGVDLVLFGATSVISFLNAEFARCGMTALHGLVSTVTDLLVHSEALQPDADNDFSAVCRRYFVDTSGGAAGGKTLQEAISIVALAEKLSDGRIGRAVAQRQQSASVMLDSFEQLIAETKDLSRTCLCRGMSDKDFLLLPTLFRTYSEKSPDLIERNLMWMFKSHAVAIMDRVPSNEVEWLTVAQHHGLPTRLLDWSLNPLVAAFFACESLSASDGCVVLLELNRFARSEEIDVSAVSEITAFFPVHAARRMAAQSGAFTIHPTELTMLDPSKVKRLIIPANLKAGFKERLFKLGVHHATLFPDLDGLAAQLRYLNDY